MQIYTDDFYLLYSVKIEGAIMNGLSNSFFYEVYSIESDRIEKNRDMDGVSYKDKKDIKYRKALREATSHTTVYLSDFYEDGILGTIEEHKDVPTRKHAFILATACGMSHVAKDMNIPVNRAKSIYRKISRRIQWHVSQSKYIIAQNNIESLNFHGKAVIQRPEEQTEKTNAYLVEAVHSFASKIAYEFRVPQSEIIKLMMCETVINSDVIFDDDMKSKASIEKECILSAIKESSESHEDDTITLYRMYKKQLSEDVSDFVESEFRKVDKIFDSVPCKYCSKHNTKARRYDRTTGKKQYKCKDCGRTFTVQVETKQAKEDFFELANSLVEFYG